MIISNLNCSKTLQKKNKSKIENGTKFANKCKFKKTS